MFFLFKIITRHCPTTKTMFYTKHDQVKLYYLRINISNRNNIVIFISENIFKIKMSL